MAVMELMDLMDQEVRLEIQAFLDHLDLQEIPVHLHSFQNQYDDLYSNLGT